MIDKTDVNNDLGSVQKFFLVLLSLFLVVSLFFFRSGFKANAMLDQLAKNSLDPAMALSNKKPTVFEFYADWCEACKEMAPDMIQAETTNSNKIDIVLLNVDNSRWFDLIDKYDVNGIPKLIFFDDKGEFKGFSLGVKKYSELNEIFLALIEDTELPSFTKVSLNKRAFVKLPLCAILKPPMCKSAKNGWIFLKDVSPVVEYLLCPIANLPGSLFKVSEFVK